MPKLTPEYIFAQETATAEHHEDLAAKAIKAGNIAKYDEHKDLAHIARQQAARISSTGNVCRA